MHRARPRAAWAAWGSRRGPWGPEPEPATIALIADSWSWVAPGSPAITRLARRQVLARVRASGAREMRGPLMRRGATGRQAHGGSAARRTILARACLLQGSLACDHRAPEWHVPARGDRSSSKEVPGMQCPRCQDAVLDEIDRSGVTMDRCTRCRGVWLDRGELEKLIARATAELEGAPQVGASVGSRPYPAPQPRYGHHDHEPPSSRRGNQGYYGGHKRRSFWHELLD